MNIATDTHSAAPQTSFTESRPRLAYQTTGEGPPVLLVMGFGMRGAVWQAQVDGLSAHHEVAIFDHRGLGDSETPERRWSMLDMAQDALRVADTLGWKTFHLVGVSMGGMIAQEIILAASSRVETLTLIATQPGGPLSWIPPLEGLKLFINANVRGPGGRVTALQRLLYPDAFAEAHGVELMRERMALQFGVPAPPRTRLMQLFAVMRHNAVERLTQVKQPTLIVRPDLDRLIHPRHSHRLMRLIPHASMLSFHDAGHGVIYQHAEALNAALLEHFAQGARG